MANLFASCRHCEDRTPMCKSYCEKYRRDREKLDRAKAAREKEKIVDSYIIEMGKKNAGRRVRRKKIPSESD